MDAPPATPPSSALRAVFVVCAVSFVAAAINHVWRAAVPEAGDSPLWRHVLFIGLNLANAALVLRRPRWYPFAFAPLVLQQLYGHGTPVVTALGAGAAPRATDFAVVLFMPLVLALLVFDRARTAPPPAAPAA